jgi:hypothetical protein
VGLSNDANMVSPYDPLYLGSGLLDFETDNEAEIEVNSPFAMRAKAHVTFLERNDAKEVWKNNLSTLNGSIEISLENPIEQKLKRNFSSEQLMTLIQDRFVENLKRQISQNGEGAWAASEEQDVTFLLSILRSELEEAKKMGAGVFPKFKKAYWQFVNEHTTILAENENDPEKIKYNGVLGTFPEAMLRASMNYLSDDDMFEYGLMKDLGISPKTDFYPKTRFSIKSLGHQVNFDMSCKAFDQEYSKALNRNSVLLKQQPSGSKISYKINPEKIDPRNLYRKEMHEKTNEYAPQFFQYLTTQLLKDSPELNGLCNGDAMPTEDACLFVKRLSATKEISAVSCSLRQPSLKTMYQVYQSSEYNLCFIVTFKEDHSQYIVLTRSSVGQTKHILDAVKQIAPPSLFTRKVRPDNTP